MSDPIAIYLQSCGLWTLRVRGVKSCNNNLHCLSFIYIYIGIAVTWDLGRCFVCAVLGPLCQRVQVACLWGTRPDLFP